MFEDFPAEGAEAAEQYAKDAYACCVAWYGPPLDAQKPYYVAQAVKGNSFCMPMFGKYYLAISKEAVTPEQLCSDIAHEMYHRVTTGRKGLAGEMWVQEVMASLTSHWFLRRQGFQEYAEAAKKHYLGTLGQADISAMRACRRRNPRGWILRGGSIYPNGFSDSAVRTGYALICLLDGDDLYRIIKAATLEEWIASLPQEKQYGVSRVLEVSTGSKDVPGSERDLDRLFDALEAKGDNKVTIAEFKQIVHLQPANGVAFFHLGYAYQEAKQFDAAVSAYLMAKELGYADRWLLHNLGSVYSQKKDYHAASEWYQEAVKQYPDWARAHYYLGYALNQIGNSAEAQAEWEKVLTLGDENYENMAQKNLQKNPLTDTLGEE